MAKGTLALCLLSTVLIAGTFTPGCRDKDAKAQKAPDKQSAIAEANRQVEAVNDKMSAPYRLYLEGDRLQARQGLVEVVAVIQGMALPAKARAHDLWIAYSRWYVLEKRCGTKEGAKVALLKARYWGLQKAELAGIDARAAIDDTEAITADDKIISIVDQLDKPLTNGKGPKYSWQKLATSTQATGN